MKIGQLLCTTGFKRGKGYDQNDTIWNQ